MGKVYGDVSECGGGGALEGVANFSALPDPTANAGVSYFVEASEGTAWLPGSLGGSYYPRGVYYSNGTEWLYQENPGQATQAEVNAGLINDKFVSPKTFNNSQKIVNSFQKNVDTTDDITEGIKTFVPALPNDGTKYLDGNGNFTQPPQGLKQSDVWAISVVNNC